MILITIPDARLCADPRVNEVGSGKVANLRVASNYRTKDDSGSGEYVAKALFFDVEIWRGAETIEEYFSKGSPIIVWGELQERSWTNKDGEERVSQVLKNANWTFPPKNEGQGEEAPRRQAQPKPVAAGVSAGDFDDDIPF